MRNTIIIGALCVLTNARLLAQADVQAQIDQADREATRALEDKEHPSTHRAKRVFNKGSKQLKKAEKRIQKSIKKDLQKAKAADKKSKRVIRHSKKQLKAYKKAHGKTAKAITHIKAKAA